MKRVSKRSQRKSINPQAKKCSSPQKLADNCLQFETSSLNKYTTAISSNSLLKHYYKSSKSAKSNRPDPSSTLFEKFRDFMNEHRIEKISKKSFQLKYLKFWESRVIVKKYHKQFYGFDDETANKVDVETNTYFPNEKTDQSTQKRDRKASISKKLENKDSIPSLKISKSQEISTKKEYPCPSTRSKSILQKFKTKPINDRLKKTSEPQNKKDATIPISPSNFQIISPKKMNEDIENLEKEYIHQVKKYNQLVINLNEIKVKSKVLEEEKISLMKDCNQMKDDIIQLKYLNHHNSPSDESVVSDHIPDFAEDPFTDDDSDLEAAINAYQKSSNSKTKK